MVGLIGALTMSLLKGPVSGMRKVTLYTVAENDMIAASALISEASIAQTNADCDEDGMIEPFAWKDAGGTGAPVGGGIIPDVIGSAKLDPWKRAYGYCVWDLGSKSVTDNVPGCGGAGAYRRNGKNVATAPSIAILSSGPDQIFQTDCRDWLNDSSQAVQKLSGSDDIVRVLNYGQFMLPRMAKARLEDLPDAACTPQSLGIMRVTLGVVQICMDTGWEEVGTSAQADANFTPVTNAALGAEYVSNAVSFSGFLKNKVIAVDGNATLLINNIVTVPPAQIVAGDMISLRANAPLEPEQTASFSVSISGVRKTWTITARDRTPTNLTISPSTQGDMDVDGVSGMAYGVPVVFTVTNTGETPSSIISAAGFSDATNFEFYVSTPTHYGDYCQGRTLAKDETCKISVRPKAAATNLAYNAALNVAAGGYNANAALSGDSLFPVTLSNATNVTLSSVSDFTANGRWASTRPKRVIIPSGTTIGATSAGIPALSSGTGRGGTLTITVNGEIQGAGGQPNGGSGGTAFLVEQAGTQLINNGAIRAGGGGGGRGGNGGAGYYDIAATVTEGPIYNSGSMYQMMYTYQDSSWVLYTATIFWGGARIWNGFMTPPSPYNYGGWTYYRGSGQSSSNSGDEWAIYRTAPSTTRTYVNGGTGGTGGRGQGYDGVAAAGTSGVSGGTNTGVGGNGGAGGGWGANGVAGNTGAGGNNGSGVAGIAGGIAGWAIQNYGNVSYSGSGARQGRY